MAAAERLHDEMQRCRRLVERAEKDRHVRWMLDHMRARGCPAPTNFLSCRPCGEVQAGGGFSPSDGVIVCADKLRTQGEVTRTIRHELVHAFDHCRAHVDWSDLDHLACAEIRAQNLSGECSWLQELNRGHLNLKKQHQYCVRRRAELSVVQVNHNPKEAAAAVDRVFDRCFADTTPYDRIP